MTSGLHGGVVNDGVSTGVAAVVRLEEAGGRGVVNDGVSTGVAAGSAVVRLDEEDDRGARTGDSNRALAFSRATLSIRKRSCCSQAAILRLRLLWCVCVCVCIYVCVHLRVCVFTCVCGGWRGGDECEDGCQCEHVREITIVCGFTCGYLTL